MSSSLAVIEPNDFALFKGGTDEVLSIMQENLGGESLSQFDLQQMRIPTSGGKLWEIPGAVEPEFKPFFDAIIIDQRNSRAYYSKPFGSGDGNTGPDCASDDGIHGIGDPGGLCQSCPMNQWGSKGAGKACGEKKVLFLLLPDQVLPTVLILPSTSIPPLKTYLLQLATRSIGYWSVVTRFELEQTQSKSGVNFARLKPRMVDGAILHQEQIDVVLPYQAMVRNSIKARRSTNIDGEALASATNLSDEEF